MSDRKELRVELHLAWRKGWEEVSSAETLPPAEMTRIDSILTELDTKLSASDLIESFYQDGIQAARSWVQVD